MSEHRRTLSATTLVGDKVLNHTGEELGDVKDIMLDLINGKIAYVVVAFGGIMGIGEKLFAIPFSKFTVDEDKKAFVTNLEKDTLKAAPGFDKDNWPDFSDPAFENQIHSYYQ